MEEKNVKVQLKEKIEELMSSILNEGIQQNNIEFLEKIVDIHKDISNEEYWEEKKDMMFRNYSESGSYGRRGVPGTGRRSYSEGSYGRRGVPGSGRGRYRGEEALEDMQYHYGNYSESYNYGAEEEGQKSFDKMIECLETFMYTIMEEADEPQKIEKIKRIARKVSEI